MSFLYLSVATPSVAYEISVAQTPDESSTFR